ncbi:MAG: ABC transporter substrate-binding protein [Pseudomonadota bacterium]
MRKTLSVMSLVLVLACTSLAAPARAQEVTIRFGILPVLDTLPLQVAVRDGLFAGQGLNVELVPFASALERDTAMQTGQLDGYFGDLIATYMLINQDVPMYIALTSWRTSPGYPMFGIALSPGARGKTLAELKGANLGISRSTIMEFLADRMEERLGVGTGYFSRMEVKKIPIRLQMLMASQIDAAILPEPLLSLARLKGGGVLATADNLDVPLTVLCLHRKYFSDGADSYVRFVTAYKEAVERLAADPERYRALMAETCRIPQPLVDEFPVYKYPLPALPADSELDEVQDWMIAKGLLRERIPKEIVLSPIMP